jgi:hypothetical protein
LLKLPLRAGNHDGVVKGDEKVLLASNCTRGQRRWLDSIAKDARSAEGRERDRR